MFEVMFIRYIYFTIVFSAILLAQIIVVLRVLIEIPATQIL